MAQVLAMTASSSWSAMNPTVRPSLTMKLTQVSEPSSKIIAVI